MCIFAWGPLSVPIAAHDGQDRGPNHNALSTFREYGGKGGGGGNWRIKQANLEEEVNFSIIDEHCEAAERWLVLLTHVTIFMQYSVSNRGYCICVTLCFFEKSPISLVSYLVSALSPVNHKGLYQGWERLS